MSIKRITAIWDESQHKGSTLLLMLAIADNANDYGLAWPGIETLMKKTRISKRAVIKQLAKAEESGELKIYRQAGKHNYYIVDVGLTDEQRKTAIKMLAERTKSGEPEITSELFAPVNHSTPGGEPEYTSAGEPEYTRTVSRTVNEPSDNADTPKGDQHTADQVQSEKTLTPHQAMFSAVCEVAGYDHKKLTPTKKKEVGQVASELVAGGAKPEQVPKFWAWLKERAKAKKWSDVTIHSMKKWWNDFDAETRPKPKKVIPKQYVPAPDFAANYQYAVQLIQERYPDMLEECGGLKPCQTD